MSKILGAVLFTSFCFLATGQSLEEKFLAKMLKKASALDESMVEQVEMYLDGGSQSVQVIADGTKTMKFRCAISDESKKIKKGHNKKKHEYTFILKVTSAALDQDMVDRQLFSKQGKIAEWSEANGALEFELDQIEILRHLDNSVNGEKFEMEATLLNSSSNGQTAAF